jgi:cell division protein FtsW
MLFIGGVKLRYRRPRPCRRAVFTAHLLAITASTGSQFHFAGIISGKRFQPYQSKLAVGSVSVSLEKAKESISSYHRFHSPSGRIRPLGTLTILGLFLAFLWRGLVIASRAPTPAAQLLAVGLTLVVCVQALLNITVVLGMGPAKGVPLPLISFGRSSLICTLAAVGMILNISQRKGAERRTR